MRNEKKKKNIGLVYKAIQRMNFQQRNDEEEWDEVYIAGVIGLIQAVNTYNPGRAKKSTYYYQCIQNEIRNVYISRTAQKRNKRPISLEDYITKLDIPLEDTIPSNQNLEKDYILKEEIDTMLSTLERYRNKKHIAMIKDNFGIGCEKKTIKAIAEKYGTSKQNVSQAKERLLKWLKKELGGLNE